MALEKRFSLSAGRGEGEGQTHRATPLKVLRVASHPPGTKHACASQVRNLCPRVSSCLGQGWGALEWEQCLQRHPSLSPGLPEREAAARARRRGHEMGEAGKFQRVKVMLRRCGDTWGKDLSLALPEIIIY